MSSDALGSNPAAPLRCACRGCACPSAPVVPTLLPHRAAGWECVSSATYDPYASPDRETVTFSTTSPEGRTLPPRRAELYIQNTWVGACTHESGRGEVVCLCRPSLTQQG